MAVAYGYALSSELPEVMIGMKIAPAQPVRNSHFAEHRVRSSGKGFRRSSKFVNQADQLTAIFLKRCGSGAADQLVVFRQCLYAFRPSHRQIQSGPSHDPALESTGLDGACVPEAKRSAERIRKMADGLVWRHAPPLARAIRTQ